MARKRKGFPEDLPMRQRGASRHDDDTKEFNTMKMMLMATMQQMGVTPEEYAAFLADGKTADEKEDLFMSMANELGLTDDSDNESDSEYTPETLIHDADKKSLRLKVQMKDVNKPPMWREIVIPADFNFSQLHQAIQAVMNFDNSHLWQFGDRGYHSNVIIGIPYDKSTGYGLDSLTCDADKTPVGAFLAAKGDKIEYIYDFGDNWTFTVSVQELTERKGDVAVCTKWKCDFQPIEDIGRVWSYLELREAFTKADKLSKEDKDRLTRSFGFENYGQFMAWLDEAAIDIEYINERLANITESGRLEF